jgi:hypothetical protein
MVVRTCFFFPIGLFLVRLHRSVARDYVTYELQHIRAL